MIDNNFIHNVIYTTLLTVKYSKEAYARLKRENGTTSSGIIRKRCRALMAKMTEPGLSSERIAAIAGCSRNFVDSLIHSYNNDGIDSVLEIAPIPGRPVQGEVKIGMNPQRPKTDLIREAAENAANPIQEETLIDKPEEKPEPTPEPTPEPVTETAEEATKEEAVETKAEQEEAGTSNLEVIEVSCRDVAKQYLQEHFGENPAPLRTIANIQECAAKYGITFNFV